MSTGRNLPYHDALVLSNLVRYLAPGLLEFKFLPIRVPGLVARDQNQIVEPDDDRLISVGAEIEMDMLPMALRCVPRLRRFPFYHLVQQLIVVDKDLKAPAAARIDTCIKVY